MPEKIEKPETLEVPDNIRARIEELERKFEAAVEDATAQAVEEREASE